MLKKSLVVFFVFCAVIAFVDIDWDAETEQTAYQSLQKQMLYMNQEQMAVYFSDLELIHAAGKMGGARGRLLHGKEAHQIHELANNIRENKGQEAVPFPAKSVLEHVVTFVVVPLRIFLN